MRASWAPAGYANHCTGLFRCRSSRRREFRSSASASAFESVVRSGCVTVCEPIVTPPRSRAWSCPQVRVLWIPVRDAARDHVRGRGHVQPRQDRERVRPDVAIAVVERDHDRLWRELRSVLERRERLLLRHGVEAGALQPAHLRGEVVRLDGQPLRDRRLVGCDRADQVVHEDRQRDRPLRQRRRQPEHRARMSVRNAAPARDERWRRTRRRCPRRRATRRRGRSLAWTSRRTTIACCRA